VRLKLKIVVCRCLILPYNSVAGLSPHKRQATASAKVKSVRLELGKEVGLPQGASFHPDHNYPDGSIIIHMQNRLFRLYRDSLARKSSYFRDRFNQELQPISRNDILLGLCPIMQVPEGNARHFAVLLDALEDFRYGCANGSSSISNETIILPQCAAGNTVFDRCVDPSFILRTEISHHAKLGYRFAREALAR
jgi:hypothetical protein